MTDLLQAIETVQLLVPPDETPWQASWIPDEVQTAIFWAVASGELIPLADHKLAVALMVEKAADVCDPFARASETKDAILALADTDALAEVQALRAERDATIRARDDWRSDYKALSAAIVGETGLSPMLVAAQARLYRPRAEAAEAELAATQARLARVVDEVLDAANSYMKKQYGNSALGHPIDRGRIRAALEGAKP